jgi:glucan biosynthesis protein C
MMAVQLISSEGANARARAVEARSFASPRLLYIDNLRILLSIVVILFHLAITYGAEGDWGYQEEGQIGMVAAVLMTLFVAICQAFFMGFFFMISSYLSPSSYDRKGIGRYLADRFKRLGIPLLFYQVVIRPLLSYSLWVHAGNGGSFWRFLSFYLVKLDSFGDGPLWFVGALLIFSVLYALWRFLAKPAPALAQVDDQAPGNVVIALFALVLGLVTFVVRIWFPVGWNLEPVHWQLAHFAQYIALYVIGIVAYRRNWFAGLRDKQGRMWLWVALALVPLFPAIVLAGGALEGDLTPFAGGVHWQSLAYCVWEQFMCVAMVVGLLVWFRDRLNRQGRLGRAMSAAAYAAYVLFAPVIMLLALALSGIRLTMALKFVLVSPVAVILCFLAGHYVRKLPLARSIL